MLHRIGLAAILAIMASTVLAGEFPGLSAEGPTGLVLIPTGGVLRGNWYAAGLHRGKVKAEYGLFGIAEAGITLPDLFDMPAPRDWKYQSRIFGKSGVEFPRSMWYLPALGIGAENTWALIAETYYGTATWEVLVADWLIEGTGGIGTGRFLREPFFGVGIIPGRLIGYGLKFVAEHSARRSAVGFRFALSKSLRLDCVILLKAIADETNASSDWIWKIDRGYLGASQSEAVRWGMFERKKSAAKPPQ